MSYAMAANKAWKMGDEQVSIEVISNYIPVLGTTHLLLQKCMQTHLS